MNPVTFLKTKWHKSLKKTKSKYAKPEERYKDLIEHLNDVIFTLDKDGIFTYVSPVGKSMLGFEPSELTGEKMASYIHDEDAGLFNHCFKESINGRSGKNELRMTTAAKQLLWVHISLIPIVKKGVITGIRGVLADVTQKKRFESQLLQIQKMEFLGRLTRTVAHDFNNMLSIILGYAELGMEKTTPDDRLYDDLMAIFTTGKRSSDITRQLLDFARKKPIQARALDLNLTMENMHKLLQTMVGKEIELVLLPGTEVWPVKMDSSQVDQLLANLCTNGRDAIPDAGRITIETKNSKFDEEFCAARPGFIPGTYSMLAVSDTGRGITPETMDKIFEPFFTTKGPGQGSGLGLAAVSVIVKQNNGFISVDSEPGKGTVIRIYLPGQTDKAAEEAHSGLH